VERNFAAVFFPKNLARTEKKRAEALNHALIGEQVASLLSMRFNREPLYRSIEEFYTQEYLEALAAGVAPAELSKIERYRSPTQREVNLLYSDIHAKEQVYDYSRSNAEE
jgi:uroporphyrinogen-III synthase